MTIRNLIQMTGRDLARAPGRTMALAAGVAIGVAALVVVLALSAGIEQFTLQRLLGVLPDTLAVEPIYPELTLGPMRVQAPPRAPLDDAALEQIRRLPGVTQVVRQARLMTPTQIVINYKTIHFVTDCLVEGADAGLVAKEVAPGSNFIWSDVAAPMPVMLPTQIIEVLNTGFTVNTGLPPLNEQALVGQHFTLLIGSSSLKSTGGSPVDCVIVGLSDRIGLGGPTVPINALPSLAERLSPPSLVTTYRAVVSTSGGAAVARVSEAIKAMGFQVPSEEQARRVQATVSGVRLTLMGFALLVLAVAAIGIGNGLGLMIREERSQIGLFRAVGATQPEVMLVYLARATAVGLLGIAIGVCIGVGACQAARWIFSSSLGALGGGIAVPVTWTMVGLASAFGLGSSVLAGWGPARQAARLAPVEALRDR